MELLPFLWDIFANFVETRARLYLMVPMLHVIIMNDLAGNHFCNTSFALKVTLLALHWLTYADGFHISRCYRSQYPTSNVHHLNSLT
jgi:hypothetical protein